MSYKIQLNKERFKFSASHFTIFSKDHAESLHGHNYHVTCMIVVDEVNKDLAMSFPFSEVKSKIDLVCAELDEKVLLPESSPFLALSKNEKNFEVRFKDKFYSFPIEDCKKLPVTNITSEALAKYLCEKLIPFISFPYQTIEIAVQESTGQTVSFIRST
jgi:6-pyruvoyltetrahydropterin/6-carboxytetrahydropterin synthase